MPKTINLVLFAAIALWNLIVFFLYFLDKQKAKKGKWRIPEKTLILSALLFGGLGAGLGMNAFRHKTKHLSFKITAVVGSIITIAAAVFVLFFLKLG